MFCLFQSMVSSTAIGQNSLSKGHVLPNTTAAGTANFTFSDTKRDEIIDIHASKKFIPEGSTIKIMKPEIWIQFLPLGQLPGETLPKTFKPTHNVSSIKGGNLGRSFIIIVKSVLVLVWLRLFSACQISLRFYSSFWCNIVIGKLIITPNLH